MHVGARAATGRRRSRVAGRSNRKCSMFGMTQSATRAPFGQRSGGRSTIGE